MSLEKKREREKKSKKVYILVLVFTLLLSTIECFAKNNTKESLFSEEQQKIADLIESFFGSYEEALDNEDTNFSDINNFYSSRSNMKNIELAKTVLYRKIVLAQEYLGGELKELNKQLQYEYESYEINGNNATVTVYVTKTFNYNITPNIESGEQNKYVVILKRNIDWEIINIDGYMDQMVEEDFEGKDINTEDIESLKTYRKNLKHDVKQFYKVIKKDLSNASLNNATRIGVNSIKTLTLSDSKLNNQSSMFALATSTTYNRSGAVKYANAHAYDYNKDYPNYNGIAGGDCTNFISQCLYEGGNLKQHVGTKMTDTCWFFKTGSNRSTSWTGAKQFNKYIKSSVSKIKAKVSNFNSMDFGDIIQLKSSSNGYATHSLIVTGIVYNGSGRSDLLFCCHSSNKRNYSLVNYYGSSNKEYIHIIGNK